jgi:hypothetical protein
MFIDKGDFMRHLWLKAFAPVVRLVFVISLVLGVVRQLVLAQQIAPPAIV